PSRSPRKLMSDVAGQSGPAPPSTRFGLFVPRTVLSTRSNVVGGLTSSSSASVEQNFALASEHIADRCRNGPDPGRPAQILMYNQPCRADCRRLLRPHADYVRRGIAEKACKLGDAYSVCRSF